MVNWYTHPAANPEWKNIRAQLPPLPRPEVRRDAHIRTLIGVGMSVTSFVFMRHVDKLMRKVADDNVEALRRMVNFRCGVNLEGTNWDKFQRSDDWRWVLAANKLSMVDLLNRMPASVVQHYLGLFGVSAGMGMGASSAAKSNGMHAAEGMGFLTGLAVFGMGLYAGMGKVFEPLLYDMARPAPSMINDNLCFYARRLEEIPAVDEAEVPQMSALPEPATLGDKALVASMALMAVKGAVEFAKWAASVSAALESATFPVPMLMVIPPQMSIDDFLSFDPIPDEI